MNTALHAAPRGKRPPTTLITGLVALLAAVTLVWSAPGPAQAAEAAAKSTVAPPAGSASR